MKKLILLQVIITTISITCNAQLSPVITCWQQNTVDTGFAGALTNVQEVNYSATFVYVKTQDIPSWIPIEYDWPNNPWFAVPMNYQFRFRLNPTPNVGPETKTGYGHIGLWKNGCSIYNPKDAKSYQDSLVWFQNAWYWEHLIGETFDFCIGHPNASGEYHTHVSPACLYDIEDSTNASPLIGYAFDSYPIYGGYGHIDPIDTTSEIVRLRSSYRIRNITDRTTLPDGSILPPSKYGPSLDSVPLGGYMEDYEYVSGLGDLDEHNGRFAITRDYPNGIYAYYTTLGWVEDVFDYSIKPVFPYVLGTAYYGEVYPSDGNTGPGSGFVEIDEAVTLYLPPLSNGYVANPVTLNLYPNPSTGLFNIQIGADSDIRKVQFILYDARGKLVAQSQLISGSVNTFDFSFLANGIYSLQVQTPASLSSFRLIIAK